MSVLPCRASERAASAAVMLRKASWSRRLVCMPLSISDAPTEPSPELRTSSAAVPPFTTYIGTSILMSGERQM